MTGQNESADRVDDGYTEMLALVVESINATLSEFGRPTSELLEDTNILHETELDSMGLAIVVVRLEEITGKDPFAGGFINFTTVGELATLYAR